MSDKNILIYSDYCNHCEEFINTLVKHPDLQKTFDSLNIDVDAKTGQRAAAFYDIQYSLGQSIEEVPTIIIKGGEYVLPGEEAFKWLQYAIKSMKKDLAGYNANEMGSFSDTYSKFGSESLHDATEQTYKFIGKPDIKIETPQIDATISQDDYSNKQKEREKGFEKPQPKAQEFTRNTNNWRTPETDLSRKGFDVGKNTNIQDKQKEIESKLQQLLSAREETIAPPNKKVDFSKGL